MLFNPDSDSARACDLDALAQTLSVTGAAAGAPMVAAPAQVLGGGKQGVRLVFFTPHDAVSIERTTMWFLSADKAAAYLASAIQSTMIQAQYRAEHGSAMEEARVSVERVLHSNPDIGIAAMAAAEYDKLQALYAQRLSAQLSRVMPVEPDFAKTDIVVGGEYSSALAALTREAPAAFLSEVR